MILTDSIFSMTWTSSMDEFRSSFRSQLTSSGLISLTSSSWTEFPIFKISLFPSDNSGTFESVDNKLGRSAICPRNSFHFAVSCSKVNGSEKFSYSLYESCGASSGRFFSDLFPASASFIEGENEFPTFRKTFTGAAFSIGSSFAETEPAELFSAFTGGPEIGCSGWLVRLNIGSRAESPVSSSIFFLRSAGQSL